MHKTLAPPAATANRGKPCPGSDTEIARRVAELQKANLEIRDARRAALNLAEDAVQARQAVESLNAELRETTAQLEAELAVTKLLHEISATLIKEDKDEALWDKIMDAAVAIMRSDMASMQMVDEKEDALRLLAWRGFPPDFAEIFRLNRPDTRTSSCLARQTGRRVIIADVETCDFVTSSPAALEGHRKTGIRAVQSTPLLSRSGELLGIISTHWRKPHLPSERDLLLLDIIARQAADFIERKQAEQSLRQSEERYRTLFDLGPIAVYSIDASGVIHDFNRRAAELWGREPARDDTDERFCDSFRMFRPDGRFMPHDQCPMAEVVSGKVSGVQDEEVLIERPDGSRVTVLVNIRPLKNGQGEVTGAINCFYDITHRKAAEDALRFAQAQLADRAGQLEQLVAERTARLQETIGELEHFSYTITHDMRAPLRAMQGFADMLLDDPNNKLSKNSADYLRRITDSAQRMDALIRDSLQYAKIVREPPPLTLVEPAPVLRGILESYPSLQPPHVQIQVTGPFPAVLANSSGLAQCFANLLVNAVKFVKPGTTPHIRIWTEVRPGSPMKRSTPVVRFWFKDNGIGIPSEYQDRIFEMFQQLDKNYEGTGIGLALVRKTAQRMGGEVGVQSEPGKGSRFWLEFQAAPATTDKQ